jgi:predicted ester cyclase
VSAYQFVPIDQFQNIANKNCCIALMQQLIQAPLAEINEAIRATYHTDASLNFTHPINELTGLAAFRSRAWEPLRIALPDVERREQIVAGGIYQGGTWIGCLGHYIGTFEKDWLGIPASRGVVAVRFAEGHLLRDGKIARSYVFLDFLDLMRQAGYWPLAPSLGSEMHWLSPATNDGVVLTAQDPDVSRASIERVLRMHAALGDYNGQPPTRAVLDEMQMARHWHPNFLWYGAAGIGSARGLKGFEDHHQIPFLVAFPDRKGTAIGHFIRIGDGRYVVTGGWGYLQATHTGGGFLGMPSTGKRVAMRVMDFYRCNEDTIVENWVPFDIPHLLLQMGVDVFGRMRHQFRQHQPISAADWLVKGRKKGRRDNGKHQPEK